MRSTRSRPFLGFAKNRLKGMLRRAFNHWSNARRVVHLHRVCWPVLRWVTRFPFVLPRSHERLTANTPLAVWPRGRSRRRPTPAWEVRRRRMQARACKVRREARSTHEPSRTRSSRPGARFFAPGLVRIVVPSHEGASFMGSSRKRQGAEGITRFDAPLLCRQAGRRASLFVSNTRDAVLAPTDRVATARATCGRARPGRQGNQSSLPS